MPEQTINVYIKSTILVDGILWEHILGRRAGPFHNNSNAYLEWFGQIYD